MTNDPLIGKHLGSYQILEPIGQGGMATVYKAMQPAMNRTVAVKILTAQMASNATFQARFKQEAQMIASLEHPHILPVFDLGEQDGLVYIAMRFMGFGTVQARMASGPVPLRDIARWIEQVASALDYAHQRGVVHRDVKPSNVLLDSQNNAFLADFGIAKWMEGSIQLTGSAVIGTPQYMSPEQGQGLKIDGRSDEYSLAVMAYEMITGQPPFQAETPLAIVLKHVTEPVTPPSLLNARVPQAISDVIVKALNKEPSDRYLTTMAFAEALSAAIVSAPVPGTAQLPASAVPTEQVHITKAQPSPRKPIGRPLAIALVMLLVIALGIGGVVLVTAIQPTPDRPVAVVTLGPNVRIETPTPAVIPIGSTPTVEASTVSSTTTPIDACQPIYAESFDDPSTGLPGGEQEGAAWGYAGGEYQLLIKAANFYQTRMLGPQLTDYAAEVDVRFASDVGGDYGLVVAARNADDYIAFVVDAAQKYAITRRTPDGSTIIQDWTFASAIKPGSAVNHLRAVQRGREIAVYANAVLLRVIIDDGDPALERQIGVTAASFARGGVEARFDNLRICKAPSSLSANRVTLIDTFDDNRNGWAPKRYSANGSTAIENGQFTINAVYNNQDYGWAEWNPNVAFDQLNLEVDVQIAEGAPQSQIGVMFGVQDLDNYYLFRLTNDGRYVVYRRVAGSNQAITEATASIAIKPDRQVNHLRLSVISNTLTALINNQPVLQAAIAYEPGFVGFWCGVFAPGQTRCTFDNLSATGTPSTGPLTIYPFCNCRRDARLKQPLTASWFWRFKSADLIERFKSSAVLTVTLDGETLVNPAQYWGVSQPVDDGIALPWQYQLPALTPGNHILEFIVHSDVELTDGFDGNGDGKPDAYGPGDFLSGYVEVVVQP